MIGLLPHPVATKREAVDQRKRLRSASGHRRLNTTATNGSVSRLLWGASVARCYFVPGAVTSLIHLILSSPSTTSIARIETLALTIQKQSWRMRNTSGSAVIRVQVSGTTLFRVW